MCCRFPARPALGAEQRQGIGSSEWVLADGLLGPLADVTQTNVHPAIAGQDDDFIFLRSFCRSAELNSGVAFDRISHLGVGEVTLLAESLGLNISGGNALFNQRAFGAVNTPFRERLIVLRRATRIVWPSRVK